MDPFVVSALLRYVGTIELSTLDLDVDADSLLPYLLLDQYVIGDGDNETRVDALAEAASLTFDALLAGALPDPITLSRDLGPLTSERRLLVWSADPEEQALLERVHVAGAIPDVDGADGWAVTVSNGGGSKIDHFLQRRASYEASTDSERRDHGDAARRAHQQRARRGLPARTSSATSSACRRARAACTCRSTARSASPVRRSTARRPGSRSARRRAGTCTRGSSTSRPASRSRFEVQLAGTVADPTQVVTWVQPLGSAVGDVLAAFSSVSRGFDLAVDDAARRQRTRGRRRTARVHPDRTPSW